MVIIDVVWVQLLINFMHRRGCAAFMGRDVSKLKAKGGGKFKYMSEKDMLELAARFAPYRYVSDFLRGM
jgi:hypothetical protein